MNELYLFSEIYKKKRARKHLLITKKASAALLKHINMLGKYGGIPQKDASFRENLKMKNAAPPPYK